MRSNDRRRQLPQTRLFIRSIELAILLFPTDNSNCTHSFQHDINLNSFTGEHFAKIRQSLKSYSWHEAIDCFVTALESSIDDTASQMTGHNDYFRFLMGPIIAELFHSTPESQRPCPFLRAMAGASNNAKLLCEQTIPQLIGTFQEVFGGTSLNLSDKSLLSSGYIPRAFRHCL